MGTEIFKEIKDSEKKAGSILEKAEKDKVKTITKAKEESIQIIDDAKLSAASNAEKMIAEKELEITARKEDNLKNIETDIGAIKKTAKKNQDKVISHITKDFM